MTLDNSGSVVRQIQVGFDECEDSVCSASFSPSPSDLTYTVNVTASSVLGSSRPAMFNGVVCKSIFRKDTNNCSQQTAYIFLVVNHIDHTPFLACITSAIKKQHSWYETNLLVLLIRWFNRFDIQPFVHFYWVWNYCLLFIFHDHREQLYNAV